MSVDTSETTRIRVEDGGGACEIIIVDGVVEDIFLGWYEIEKNHGLWRDAKLIVGEIISTVSSKEKNRERLIGRLRGLRNAIDQALNHIEGIHDIL